MRKLLILILFIISSSGIFAQNETLDSLNHLLASEKEDSNRVMMFYQIAKIYAYSNPDTALSINQQGLELARKINFKRGQAICLRGIASFFVNTGNYPQGLFVTLQALKIAEDIHDEQSIALLFRSAADVYFYEGDAKRSIEFSNKSIAIFERLHDTEQLGISYIGLGDTYEKTDQLDSALRYTMRGYESAKSKKDADMIGVGLNNLGNIYRKLGRTDTARKYYEMAIPYFKQTSNNDGFCELYLGMANIFLQQKKTDSTLYYARLSYTIAHSAGFIAKVLAASTFLADYYRGVRNIDSAYAYQVAGIVARDSLFSQQKASQIQSMTYDEGMRQQQIEEAKQQAKAEAKQNILIGGLAAMLIVAFLLIRNNSQKRKANEQLQKQKAEIDNKAQELSLQKENLQQSYYNVEQLGEIGRKITASLTVEKIIGTVYDNVNALMDAAVFGIGIYNDVSKQIGFPSTYENGQALPFYANSIDDKNRFGSVCFNSGQEIIIGNLDKEYQNHIQQVATPHEGGQPVSIIFLPLIVKEKKLGVITVQSFAENAYSDYHLFMLRNIATYTAIAIENAASFGKLNQTVSTLKSTQSQLIQSEKMASLGELTAGIAHEIQNPLNFVNNFSEINAELIEELRGERQKVDGERNTALEDEILNNIEDNEKKINHHGKRADAIVKGMLQHSRSGTTVKEPTDLNALADEYLRLSYHGLRAKDKDFNATLKTDFDGTIDKIDIVSQDLGRVLLNLYNNAFYAVAERKKAEGLRYEPTINVSTKKSGNQILITVSDNGNGIPKNIVDKIYQPFFTTKPTGQGTGLGLSLSYDIIKAHGGEIKVETKEKGGTEFVIHLPVS